MLPYLKIEKKNILDTKSKIQVKKPVDISKPDVGKFVISKPILKEY